MQEPVLVFGGNGFIGSEFVAQLIQQGTYRIYMICRGNWYYDSGTRIKPFVTHIQADRYNLDASSKFMDLVRSTAWFKYVFDFSGYKPGGVEQALKALAGKVGLYVYVSTDSVYEVCVDKSAEVGGKSREVDSIRPDTEEEQARLNGLDEYGNEKLQGEEILIQQSKAKNGTPYLIVRCPDVIGPRDRDMDYRMWMYIMWIQFYDLIQVPVYIPPSVRNLRTSYVYVNDVVRAILHLINIGAVNEIYNLGFETMLTMEQLLDKLKIVLGRHAVPYDYEPSAASFHRFPSVLRGGVDVSKLMATGFKPTDLDTALKDTAEFYKAAFFMTIPEKDDVIREICKCILPAERTHNFVESLQEIMVRGDFN